MKKNKKSPLYERVSTSRFDISRPDYSLVYQNNDVFVKKWKRNKGGHQSADI